MKKSVILIPAALLVLIMPMMAGVQADTSSQSATTISQNYQQSLQGHWVDTSGRGVLTFDNGTAFLSPTGAADPKNTYQVELSADDQLTMRPAEGSNKANKTITTEVDWQKQSFSFKNGLYNFVRPPQISPKELDGYWHEEADMQGAKHIRAMEYKDNATSYDYYWWRVTQALGTFQKGVDRDVPLKVQHGFVFTDPKSSSPYVHYAIKKEGDTIYYVDRNGATWSETKTDTLYVYEVPKGFKEMKDWMTP
jgi:hypothetical protein|tara:strand:- start:5512 stop:6264 length:753 start_codon:yes stop_codon:yes gene_type:complete